MFAVLIGIHIIVCILLIFTVLIQSGRSSGLVEGFSFAESILGTKTPKFFTRLTAVLAGLFIINCLILTFLTYQRTRSLVEKVEPPKKEAVSETKQEPLKEPTQIPETEQTESTK